MSSFENQIGIKGRTLAIIVVVVVGSILALSLGGRIIETVKRGTYQIKQAAITGKMTAHMKPGLYLQNFGDIVEWPKAKTFYFTKDVEEGAAKDQSIEVRYNEGSVCGISGSCRVILPVNPDLAIALITEHGYQTYEQLAYDLILKVVRNSLRLTANLMSARESYSEKRPNFLFWAEDQIQDGLYVTTDELRKVIDPVSGKEMTKKFKVIKTDEDGNALHQKSFLDGLGIAITNFDIKIYDYEDKVKQQIADQQDAYMAVETARANALKAEQDAKTKELEGKALVMVAQYEKEQEKVRAVVDAEKVKEVAVIKAQQQVEVEQKNKERALVEAGKKLEVAEYAKREAGEYKQQQILQGEGEAEKKSLILAADGALQQKLATYEKVMAAFFKGYSTRNVPQLIMGGTGEAGLGTDEHALDFTQGMMLLVAKQMGLDFSIPQGATAPKTN